MNGFDIHNPDLFVFDEYYSKIWVEKFYTDELPVLAPTKLFLCPVNALSVVGSKVLKKENCINCNLCELKYIKLKDLSTQIPPISDYFMTDYKRLCVVLKYLYPDSWCTCEVKTEGNYRNKRIDLVLKKGREIYVVKVLTNTVTYNLYLRSYSEIVNDLTTRFPPYNTQLLLLVQDAFEIQSQKDDKLIVEFSDFTKGVMF